nr:acyl-CoA dehydrogenase family protein [Rhodococcus sp. (in: high G+C Gram-positive bacteria)]
MTSWPERARNLADTVLFPEADSVDFDGQIPDSHFESLAAEGFYGLASGVGESPEMDEIPDIIELLCGGCLATAFTWMQHNGVVMSMSNTSNAALKSVYLDAMIDGSIKAGVAFAGAIPRPPKLFARRTDTGYVLDGSAPFVSGWGIVDVLQVSARDEFDDSIVHSLMAATEGDGVTVERLDLIAADASNTVRMRFENVRVPDSRVVSVVTDDQFQAGQIYGSWINGCMAMGIARRAITQMTELGLDTTAYSAVHTELRGRFDNALAGGDDMSRVRADASEFAVRAAAALVAGTGSSAIVGRGTAERLVREAAFTLVAAGRPAIRTALIDALSSSHEQGR